MLGSRGSKNSFFTTNQVFNFPLVCERLYFMDIYTTRNPLQNALKNSYKLQS